MKKNKILILLLLVFCLFASVLSFNTTVIASTDYYSSISSSATGNTLKQSLRTLITSTHKKITSYEDCKDPEIVEKTDGDPNNPGNIILFWSGLSIESTWDSGKSWNREHVWPQSQGWFGTSGAGSDLHHIRPTDPSTNGSHNNNPYGIVSGDYYVSTSEKNGGVETNAKCKGGVFEPGDDKKGDTARIIFYLLVRYSGSDSYPITNVATSMDLLLEWNREDPVDASETRRNNAVYEIQGNRNPFIDNSNYANLIWDEENASAGGDSGNSGGSGSEDTKVYYPVNLDYSSSECSVIVSGTQDNNNYYTGNVTIKVTPLSGYSYVGIKDLTTGEYITTSSIYQISNISKAYNLQVVLTSIDVRQFVLVTSMDEIDYGSNIIIVSSGYNYALSTEQKSNNRGQVAIEKADYVINEVDGLQVIELKEGNVDNTYALYTGEGYLYSASSSSNHLKTQSALDNNGSWDISIDSNGIATVISQGDNTHNILRYNNSSSLFASYEAGNTQKDISIYVQSEIVEEDPIVQYLNVFKSQSTYTSLMMSYDVQGETTEKTYSYTFTQKVYSENGTQNLNGVNWTLAGDGGYWDYNSTSGAHLGSGSKPYKSLTLTSEKEFSSIQSISITTCGGSSTNASFNVLVGGETVGTQKITSTSTKYAFNLPQSKSGIVSFNYTQTSSKAIYIKAIEIVYGEDSRTFELNSAALRFGSYISKDIYENLNKDDTVWGIEYFTGTNNTWDTATIKTVVCTPAQVSEPNSSVINENGEYYQFALVITNMKINHIDLIIHARVFVEYEGTRYYMSSTTESLRDTANLYLAMDNKGLFEEHIGMLEYLSNYEG